MRSVCSGTRVYKIESENQDLKARKRQFRSVKGPACVLVREAPAPLLLPQRSRTHSAQHRFRLCAERQPDSVALRSQDPSPQCRALKLPACAAGAALSSDSEQNRSFPPKIAASKSPQPALCFCSSAMAGPRLFRGSRMSCMRIIGHERTTVQSLFPCTNYQSL